jgi:hypothetical protein
MALTGSLSTDKASYVVGDTITVTVTHGDSANVPEKVTLTGTIVDANGVAGTVQGDVTITHTSSLVTTVKSVVDTDGRTYTQVSDDGATSVWTATA